MVAVLSVMSPFSHIMMSPSLPFKTLARMASRASAYSHAKTGGFSQVGPVLHNPFRDDPMLEKTLKRILPQAEYDKVAQDLDRFGDRIVNEINDLGRQAELNDPKLEQLDAWGKRVDKLVTCPEWNRLKEICAEEGIISIGYDTSADPVTRRIHQVCKLFLFSPSAGLVTCPMAMTDGAVKTLQALGLYGKLESATTCVDRLTSRDGKKAWTSGQWMTEKKGGSDVGGGCDTYAVHEQGNMYRLHGYKWFSSAIDADVALTLARVVDKDGNAETGSRGLSLFLVRIRDENGLNGVQMMRLKNKLGTRQVPTAELLLDGMKGELISQPGRGVASIANMLNITRIHNAVASVSGMRRIISLARDYSTRREVFGQKQKQWPLHTTTLAKMEVETRGCFLLLIESARLIGLSEAGKGTLNETIMLRLITPILKLYTGKMCVPLISEGIECFGGQGYMEDTGLPAMLRDAQVTPIWEGTTNVLSLDVLRVFSGKDNVLLAFRQHIESLLSSQLTDDRLVNCKSTLLKALSQLEKLLVKVNDSALKDNVRIDSCARNISFGIARIYAGSLLVQHAAHSSASQSDIEVAHRWCTEQPLLDLQFNWFSVDRISEDRSIVFENFAEESRKSKL